MSTQAASASRLARAAILILLPVACSEPTAPSPDRLLPDAGSLAAAHGGGGQIWVTAQDASELKILKGVGSVETVALPTGSGPHEINFSPGGAYAYVANVGDGSLMVVRTEDRQVVASFALGGAGAGDVGTHQGKPSPDGSVVLVSQIPSRTLIKIAADEAAEEWTVVGSLELPESPLCTAFRADGERAYVALGPGGIAVIDVPTLTLVTGAGVDGIIPTEGSVQCGLVESKDGTTIYVDSNGGGGHFYRLDTTTDILTDQNYVIDGADLHGFGVNPSENKAFAAARGGDELKVIDLTAPRSVAGTVPLDPRPEVADRPDKVAVRGNYVYVTLRTSGQVARVHGVRGRVTLIDLVAPSANALHGIAVRP